MIEIYTKENCEFCIHAKQIMKNRGMIFTEYKLGEHFVREDVVTKFPTMKTYPIIVNDGVLVGGFDKFVLALHEGKITFERLLNG